MSRLPDFLYAIIMNRLSKSLIDLQALLVLVLLIDALPIGSAFKVNLTSSLVMVISSRCDVI